MMEELKKKFQEFIRSGSARKKKKAAQLIPLKEEVAEARRLGYSHEEIANFLKQHGMDISRHRVREFCLQTLKEKPKRKTSKR